MQTLHQKYITAKSVIEFSLTIQMLTHAGNVGVHDTRQAIQLRAKQACASFVYANVERQLKNLLQSPGKYNFD